MTIQELNQPLNHLKAHEQKANNEDVVAWLQKMQAACSTMPGANDAILELAHTIDADHQSKKMPYHHILLAYAHHHFGETDTAIRFADMSVRYFNNRLMTWHQSMSHWFLGILLCKQGELDKAKIEIDYAIHILAKLEKEDAQLGNYDNNYKDQINIINEGCAEAITEITATGDSLFSTNANVPSDVFSGIIDRIKIQNDDFLNGLWVELCESDFSDIDKVDAHFDRLDSMLKEKKEKHNKNEKRINTNPYLNIFLAHCYNFRSYKKESQYPLALHLAWNAVKGFQSTSSSYNHQLNMHNHALSRWYLGMLYCNRDDEKSYRIQLEKAKHLFVDLKQLYDDTERINEIKIIQDCLDAPTSPRIWPQSLLNRPKMQKPDTSQKSPYHWLGFKQASSTTPLHNRRASDRNPPPAEDIPKE